MYGAVASSRPDSSPVSAGTSRPRPAWSAWPGGRARAAARRPTAAVNPVAMTMAHSEGRRNAVAEVPMTVAMTCMSR